MTSELTVPTNGRRSLGGSYFVVPMAALGALIPWLSGIENRVDAMLLALMVIICAVGTARSYVRGARPMGLVFYPFMFAWLTVGPTYQLSHGGFPWGDTPLFSQKDVISTAVFYNLLAVIAFTVGYEFWRRKPVPNPTSAEAIEVRALLLWGLIVLGFALAPLVLSASGGLEGMFSSRDDRVGAAALAGLSQEEVGGFRYALSRQLPIAVSISAACLATIRARVRIKKSGFMSLHGNEFAALVLSLSLLILYCNPIANSRYIAVIAFGSVALYLFQPRSARGGFLFGAASVAGTLVIYPLLDIFRHGFDSTNIIKSGAEAFGSVDFDGFQQVANAIVFVQDKENGFGHYTLSALLYFLPRSVWEGKATPASIDVATNRGYNFTDLSLPFHAEMFIDFGLIGMIIIMVLFGSFSSRTDTSWLAKASARLGLAAPLMAVALLGLLRGPLGSLAPIYLTAVGLFLLGLKHVKTDPPAAGKTLPKAAKILQPR